MILLTFIACGPAPAPAAEAELPVAWDEDGPTLDPPALTASEVEADLETTFADVFQYHANVMFDAYNEVMTYADDSCPLIASGNAGSMWDTVGCSTTSGAQFSGFVSNFVGVQGEFDVQRMRGEATVDLPDGSTFTIAGDAATNYSTHGWWSEVAGVMRYDGASAAGTWVEDQPDVNLSYEIETNSADESLTGVVLDGSVAGLEGTVTAVAFTELAVSPSSACVIEPAGSIEVRDANGVWASVTFDVTGSSEEGWEVDQALCDGCADLTFDGTSLGQVCVDTNLLLGTELPPW